MVESKADIGSLLLTHLYEYFGVVLGCSKQGGDAFPDYNGSGSQYQVHKFVSSLPNVSPSISLFVVPYFNLPLAYQPFHRPSN
jgi:hypothetical protein